MLKITEHNMERRIKLNQRRYFHFEIEMKNEYRHVELEYRKNNNEIRLYINTEKLVASLKHMVGLNLIYHKTLRVKRLKDSIKFMLPIEKTIGNQNLSDYQLKKVMFYNKKNELVLKLEY